MIEDFVAGLSLIREMSKEDIIEELIEAQRTHMNTREMSDLKAELIQFRLAVIRKRMIAEAGMTEHPGFLGTHLQDKDE
jgi:hypothetical protein